MSKKGKILLVVNGKDWHLKVNQKEFKIIQTAIDYDHPYVCDYLQVAGGKTDSICWLKLPREPKDDNT